MRKSVYIGIVLFTIILAITIGLISHIYKNEKMEKASMNRLREVNSITNNSVVQAVSQEEKTTPNTMIIFETYFAKCGHSEVEKNLVKTEDVNKTKEQIREKYSDYKLVRFSQEEIKFYREKNQMCENHYVLKEKDGKIVVYSFDESGAETLKTETDILTKYLPEEDIELLKKGIKANSEAQLNQILSDYE